MATKKTAGAKKVQATMKESATRGWNSRMMTMTASSEWRRRTAWPLLLISGRPS